MKVEVIIVYKVIINTITADILVGKFFGKDFSFKYLKFRLKTPVFSHIVGNGNYPRQFYFAFLSFDKNIFKIVARPDVARVGLAT